MEGVFGSGKRKYSLDLIMARLKAGAETSISMAFLVMCAEKVLRLLRFFSVLLFCGPKAWFCTGHHSARLEAFSILHFEIWVV